MRKFVIIIMNERLEIFLIGLEPNANFTRVKNDQPIILIAVIHEF